MQINILKVFLFCFSMAFVQSAIGQDFTNIKDAKPVTVNSSISANQVVYGSSINQGSRDPYSYCLAGNLNLNFYGVLDLPFTFTYTSQKMQYSQPISFNQFGVAPSYKWAKAYIGYNSMTFSSYTLNGHQFLGGGIELTPPGWFKISAMYGRLRKAIEQDSLKIGLLPTYQRMGFGAKIGLKKDANSLDIIIFKAKDDTSSVNFIPKSSEFNPMENLVLSINSSIQIVKRVNFTFEIASSSLTRNMRANSDYNNPSMLFKIFDFIQKGNSSTSQYEALKSAISYGGASYSIGLGYERIDPDYKTLGSYYFTNDLENITINASKSMMEGKLNVSANFGKQRNNLDNKKLSDMNQYVSSVTISIAPSQRINLSGSYSNFSSYTYIRSSFDNINQTSPYANLDTLNFTQLTNSGTLSGSYQIGQLDSKEKRQNITLSTSYQKASDKQNNSLLNAGSTYINSNVAYTISYLPINFSITPILNASIANVADKNTITLGPSLSVVKAFFKKRLSTNITFSFNQTYVQKTVQSKVFVTRLGYGYTLHKNHILSLSTTYLNRNTKIKNFEDFSEFTGIMGYNYSF